MGVPHMKYKNLLFKIGKTILFYAFILIIWELFCKLGIDVFHWFKPYMIASPITVAKTLYNLALDNNVLWIAIAISLRRLFIGFAISLVVGALISLLVLSLKHFYKDLKALILGIQSLPNVCWIPFATLWFGLGEDSIIFVIIMGSSFSIANSIDSAIRGINPIYIKAAKTMSVGGFKMIKDVVLPAALPQIVSGLKQGWSFSWRALMAGEVLSASLGLGQLLVYGRDIFDMGQIIGIMCVIMFIGIIFDKLIFGIIEDKLLKKRGLS